MKINNYYVEYGPYTLGVDTEGEVILAAFGDYSRIEGLGYPSVLGEFFECHSNENVWNMDYECDDTCSVQSKFEKLNDIMDLNIKIWKNENNTFIDVTSSIITAHLLPYLTELKESL